MNKKSLPTQFLSKMISSTVTLSLNPVSPIVLALFWPLLMELGNINSWHLFSTKLSLSPCTFASQKNNTLILHLPIRHLYFQSGIIWITKWAHRSHLTCYHDFIWMENSPLRHFCKILVWVYASVTPGLEGRHRRVPGFSSLTESVRDPALKMRRGRETGRKQRRIRCLSLRSGL